MSTPEPALAARRPSALRWLRTVAAVVMLAAVAYALVRNWAEVSAAMARIPAWRIATALVLSLLSPIITVLGWRVVMADLGSRLSPANACSVFFVGQLGKYLPGSLWSVVAQAEMAARLGIPRTRTAVVGLLTIGFALIAGGAAGLPAVPTLLAQQHASIGWVVLAAALLGLAMWPRLINAGIALALRLLKRPPLEHALTWSAVWLATTLFTLAWLVTGAAVWVISGALASTSAAAGQLALVTISGYCLAACIGMVSFLAPAGLGIRDGLLIVLLMTIMPVGAAGAVVVLVRFLSLIADVLCAAAGYLWGVRHNLLVDSVGAPAVNESDDRASEDISSPR